jgi:formylglycine-generating enzyme required for sulfatase activity
VGICSRAGKTTKFFWGDDSSVAKINQYVWWGENTSSVNTVAQKLANPWGLYDMLGNASEWVYDVMVDYVADEVTDPTGGPLGGAWTGRLVRGGSYNVYEPSSVSCGIRIGAIYPVMYNADAGFRVCRNVK